MALIFTDVASKWLRTRLGAEVGRGPGLDRARDPGAAQNPGAEVNPDLVRRAAVRSRGRARSRDPSLQSVTTKTTANLALEVGVSRRTTGAVLAVVQLVEIGANLSHAPDPAHDPHRLIRMTALQTILKMATNNWLTTGLTFDYILVYI